MSVSAFIHLLPISDQTLNGNEYLAGGCAKKQVYFAKFVRNALDSLSSFFQPTRHFANLKFKYVKTSLIYH